MRPKLPLDLIRYILLQTIELLIHLNTKGIIYRDLKLTNVLIDSQFCCKFVDFGLSKRIKKERTHSVCGTPHALPPEIFSETGYSYEVDAYTLGVLAFELLTGEAPFGYKHSFEDIKNHDYQSLILKISKVISDKTAADFVGRLLQTDPNLRSTLSQARVHEFLDASSEEGIDKYLKKEGERLIAKYPNIKEDLELVEDTDVDPDQDANFIPF